MYGPTTSRARLARVDSDDDRPPVCPACGVTMGIVVAPDGSAGFECLECGFADESDGGGRIRTSVG